MLLPIIIISPAAPEFVQPDAQLDFVVLADTPVVLDCTAAGVPTPNYTWSDGPTSQNLAWKTSKVTLQFSEPTEYTCTASNEHGSIRRVFTIVEAGSCI